MAKQLTIYGTEVDYRASIKKHVPLNHRQREILRAMAYYGGEIRSVQAGVIVHRDRGHCGFGKKGSNLIIMSEGTPVVINGTRKGAISCCQYASTDGNEAMKRLMRRGLVRREERKWVQVNG